MVGRSTRLSSLIMCCYKEDPTKQTTVLGSDDLGNPFGNPSAINTVTDEVRTNTKNYN